MTEIAPETLLTVLTSQRNMALDHAAKLEAAVATLKAEIATLQKAAADNDLLDQVRKLRAENAELNDQLNVMMQGQHA